MEELFLRHAQERDLTKILDIYESARAFMRAHGNPRQWNTTWPPESLVKEDIEKQRSYVVCGKDDIPCGVFVYLYGKDIDPTYRDIENGHWKDESPYGVVHRLASDGSKKGIGSFVLNRAFEKSHHLRVDTHPDNKVMQNLLKQLGFEQTGIIHVVEDNDPRLAYEKIQ